jgi:hypothetical protein
MTKGPLRSRIAWSRKDTKNLDLIAHNPCDIAALMNSSVCIVRNNTMTRFGWAAEDVAR